MKKNEIAELFKKEGLEVVEDTAMVAVKASIELLKRIVPQVSSGFGFALNMFLGKYENEIYKMIDKLDGKVDLK